MATEPVRSQEQDAQTQTRDADEFAALLKQSFKPRTERAATELDNAVKTLVE
jgi:type VI secretion system protein ImpC